MKGLGVMVFNATFNNISVLSWLQDCVSTWNDYRLNKIYTYC
jgi:hypothetical protein